MGNVGSQYSERVDNLKAQFSQIPYKLPIVFGVGVICLIIGIILWICYFSLTEIILNEQIIEYTDINCARTNDVVKKCSEYFKIDNEKICVCYYEDVRLKSAIGPVKMFYSFETFNFSEISQSRDDQQLLGNLSRTPSENCAPEEYRFHNDIPIAPCGALANAMFADDYNLSFKFNESSINLIKSAGVLGVEDKKLYHNPPNISDFHNFSAPVSWSEIACKNFLCESTSSIINRSCAFEDERFIGWMTPAMKWKPYAVLAGGLQERNYTLQVIYRFGSIPYFGKRVLKFAAPETIVHKVSPGLVITFMFFGCFFTIIAGYYIFKPKLKQAKEDAQPEIVLMKPLHSFLDEDHKAKIDQSNVKLSAEKLSASPLLQLSTTPTDASDKKTFLKESNFSE